MTIRGTVNAKSDDARVSMAMNDPVSKKEGAALASRQPGQSRHPRNVRLSDDAHHNRKSIRLMEESR
jgi:hypothetical protein